MTTSATNPFLQGNCAPVEQEITVDSLQVVGHIPEELVGIYLRNGPNPQFPPLGRYHWFDGDGMIHGIHIANGKASYLNRYVHTEKFEAEHAEGRALVPGILEIGKMQNTRGLSLNTANTAFVWHAHRLLALWEVGDPHEIQLPRLETVGKYTFHDRLTSAFTAHPKVDRVTNEMMFFGYSPFVPPFLQYGVVSAVGEIERIVLIELPAGVMMHDFAITEHYTIFMDLPFLFNGTGVMRGEPSFIFQAEHPSRFGILPRHGDDTSIRWFELPSCWVWHTLNAYEDGDEIILLACRAQSTTMLTPEETTQTLQTVEQAPDISRLHRWSFNLKTGAIREEQLDTVPSEFPRVNDDLLGRHTRYGYVACNPQQQQDVGAFDGLIKYDLQTGQSYTHTLGPHRLCGEGLFVPRQGASVEDDGWLLSLLYDKGAEQSELLVINAQDMSAEPMARILLPQRVPYGFHGAWVSEAEMAETKLL